MANPAPWASHSILSLGRKARKTKITFIEEVTPNSPPLSGLGVVGIMGDPLGGKIWGSLQWESSPAHFSLLVL